MTSPMTGMTVLDIHNVYSMDVAANPRTTDTRPPAGQAKKLSAKPTKAATDKPSGKPGKARK